jgi:lipid-binding SYLF domain-containing protein
VSTLLSPTSEQNPSAAEDLLLSTGTKKMANARKLFLALILATTAAVSGAASAYAATAEDLNRDADHALQVLYKADPVAADLAKSAKAVLIFPKVIKAGLVFGGSYGEGVMEKNHKVVGYYNSFAGSWGLQAGAQSYGYVVFLMNNNAVDYIDRTAGWEVGVGPTVVLVDKGVAKNLSTSTLKNDAYAFIFDQEGLMAGLSIEGTKISKIKH